MKITGKLSRGVYLGFLGVFFLNWAGPAAFGTVRLPSVFGNDMVLQRDRTVTLWGWAEPDEAVTITLGAIEVKSQAGADGRWEAKLPSQPAGGPHTLVIEGSNKITLTNVLFGEVWIGSGQSNMAWQVKQSENAEKAMAEANYPEIRLFQVPRKTSGIPLDDVSCSWAVCTPESAGQFSAAAYFFGLELHQALKVPVGLIATSWGGTRIEPWTPRCGFEKVASLSGIAAQIDQAEATYREKLAAALNDVESWVAATRMALAQGGTLPWFPKLPSHGLDGNQQPTGLYNAMVHPLVPYTLRGAIWYQGEANRSDGMLYADKMKALIEGWRELWDDAEMPFYYVQLAPYHYGPEKDLLPELWYAQLSVLNQVKDTGMAVTNDIGNIKDIHPRNKQDVGKRLALWALARTYGHKDVVYSGPLYRSLAVEGNKIRVSFDHTGSGLVSRDGQALTHFEVGDATGTYVKADAVIEGDSVLVWNDTMTSPSAVRFAWDQDAVPNLMNKEGLPASAFRAVK